MHNMIRFIILFLLFTIIYQNNFAQIPYEQQRQIDAVFAEWNRTDSPGGALAIIKNGQILYKKGYGMADLEHGVPISSETVFYAGSVSKQFVAMCILLLHEQGKLSLDDKVKKYIPELHNYDTIITIRQMVHHISGLRDYLSLLGLSGRDYLDHIPKQMVLDMIFRQKELNFEPGTQYAYSNSGYFLLAEIIGRVSGKTLRQYADEHIFQPLGMTHSFFNDNTYQIIPDRAFSYQRGANGIFTSLLMRFDLVGSGGLYTTVEDLYKWDQNFYKNKLGKAQQSLIDTMLTEGKFNNGASCGYAFALSPGTYRGLPTYGHTGSLAGYRAYYVRFPKQIFSIILLGNVAQFAPTGKAEAIADILLADQLAAPTPDTNDSVPETPITTPTYTAQDLQELPGKYYSEELNAYYNIILERNEIYIQAGYESKILLNDFVKSGFYDIIFLREGKRKAISGMVLKAGLIKNIKFEKVE
ncbi:MAG: serine hydrolase domain-containing protein [Saprospiraceae bacterium]|nr:serine hydrolase domain-containing protein [Saprospiraceae bacterium]